MVGVGGVGGRYKYIDYEFAIRIHGRPGRKILKLLSNVPQGHFIYNIAIQLNAAGNTQLTTVFYVVKLFFNQLY